MRGSARTAARTGSSTVPWLPLLLAADILLHVAVFCIYALRGGGEGLIASGHGRSPLAPLVLASNTLKCTGLSQRAEKHAPGRARLIEGGHRLIA